MKITRVFFVTLAVLTVLVGIAAIAIPVAQGASEAELNNASTNNDYAGSSLLNIPLVWKPKNSVSSLDAIDLTAFQNATFTIKPFKDFRLKPSEIGMNSEKRNTDKILYVTTRDNVAEWLTDRFRKTLSDFDITVVKTGGTLTLEGDIMKFYVTEESVYKANIGLKIRLKSKKGDVLLEEMIAVTTSNWGSSYKAENYQEALSDACIDVVFNLLKNEPFQQAVKKSK